MTEREMLMRKIAANDFAVVDLHLYLDTHPNNKQIAQKLDEYAAKSNMLKKEYEERFGPITPGEQGGNRWAWIANPWPWDKAGEENC
ncbi:MAG: spore coat protein CotJB [Acutalibacteraceae bacterium]|nr:spore coat protein CotJB [Acutalibacteraceae bacterium]HIR03141.1 spore coat protein CotJB [Candidatus Scatovicinus merdipullorum]